MAEQISVEIVSNVATKAYQNWLVVASLCFLSLWVFAAWRRWSAVKWYWAVVLWIVMAIPTMLPIIPDWFFEHVPEYGIALALMSVVAIVGLFTSSPSFHAYLLTAMLLTWLAEVRWPGWYRGRFVGKVVLALCVFLVSTLVFVCVGYVCALVWRSLTI